MHYMTDSAPAPVIRRRWWHATDRVAALASFLCAIHCAVLPFIIVALPVLGLSFLADHRFEVGFVIFASLLASVALVAGYRRHGQRLPLMLAVPGIALLIIGVTLLEGRSLVAHSIMVTIGGLMLASAHFVNLRMDRGPHAGHLHGPSSVHP